MIRRTLKIALVLVALTLVANVTAQGRADELRIGWEQGQTFDSIMGNLVNENAVMYQVYIALVRLETGGAGIVPDLATEWELSEDGLDYTFTLREGVTWHNGYGEIRAQDVVNHFERVLDPETLSPFRSTLDGVEEVRAVDDYTVAFRLSEPDAFFLNRIAVNAGLISNTEAVAEFGEDYGRNPVSAGPYIFREWMPGQYVLLEANPEYYGGEPKTKYVRFVHIPDESARRIALETGQVDIFWNATDPIMVESFERAPGFEVHSIVATNLVGPFINTKIAPFDDVRVRQAMAYAIDYEGIVEGVRGGLATKPVSHIPAGLFGHTDEVRQYDYDPERARELLAEAGYPNGFETTIGVLNTGYTPDMFAVIQSNFRDVGINLRVQLQDPPTWANSLATGNVPMAVLLHTSNNPDHLLTRFFYGPSCVPAGSNFSCWDGADDLIREARSELDEERRTQIYAEIQSRLMEELPLIPVLSNLQIDITSSRVQNYVKGLFFEADLREVVLEER